MDGTGSTARFNSPNAVALDAADNLYVADFGNNTIRLGTPLPLVTGLGWNSNAFSFDLIGLPGQTLVTEVSTDLSTWTPLQTNTINNGTLRISDPASDTIPWRFYRARQQ